MEKYFDKISLKLNSTYVTNRYEHEIHCLFRKFLFMLSQITNKSIMYQISLILHYKIKKLQI